jgi:NAD dependent epimerase/dehydratase
MIAKKETATGLAGAKVLVTGAGGFIGSHLVEHLVSEGAKVTALFRYTSEASLGHLAGSTALKSIKSEFGDIRDPESCARALKGQEFVFHLAAQIAIPYSYLSPRDFVAVNVGGTVNLLQAALSEKRLRRFLLVSTSEVYGSAQRIPIDETHPLHPQSPYAASKVSAEMMAGSYADSFALPLTVVRAFNTFGPRQSTRAIVPAVISQALDSDILKLGALHPKRDFLFVKDTARGMALAAVATKTLGKTLNLCSGAERSVKEIVQEVGSSLGKKLQVKSDSKRLRPKTSEVNRLLGDGTLAKELCGFVPEHDFASALAETIRYYASIDSAHSSRDYRI